ncbi:nucleolar complex protein 3 homolog, partial [Rhagoletis pomonella]|uniref:nucleolar complex protein 3 homolog n=1 Tax=Rhagoletis pomonella TaxID=28610 RepID=UPI00177DE9CE
MGTKKVKISAVKRNAHLKSKKTPLPKQQQHKIAQQKAAKDRKQNIFRQKAKKREHLPKKQKQKNDYYNDPLGNDDDDELDASEVVENIADMLDGDDLEYLHEKGLNKQRKRKNADVEEEKQSVGLEKAYTSNAVEENDKKKVKINLLPIKSRDGHIITRSAEVDYIPKPKVKRSEEAEPEEVDGDENIEYEDSDDDVVNEICEGSALPELKKKLISTTDLLIARQQEIERQKYRIGIICSGLLEKPEDKMRNFNALFELMEETNAADAPNLLTVRRLAIVSTTEIFKDILPEYRVGQVDTKMQT